MLGGALSGGPPLHTASAFLHGEGPKNLIYNHEIELRYLHNHHTALKTKMPNFRKACCSPSPTGTLAYHPTACPLEAWPKPR